MDLTYNLQSKKNMYYNLIDGLSAIVKNLDGCTDNLNDVLNKFESSFNIDLIAADDNKIRDNYRALVDRNNTIKNVIIPELHAELKRIDAQINALDVMTEDSTTINVSANTSSNASNVLKPSNTKEINKRSTTNKMLY